MGVTSRRFVARLAILGAGGWGLACSPSSPSSAAGLPEAALARADSAVAAWVEAERIPGAVLRVSRDGEVLHRRAYGWAQLYDYGGGQYPGPEGDGGPGIRRLEDPVPMTAETVFDLASVTKVMATAWAIMLLVDREEVSLDAPVHTYLEHFRGPDRDRITLRHLLTHRSGLPQWLPVYYHASDPEGAHAYLRDVPLTWQVGSGRHYSDLGFMLLGRVVERVTGQTLGGFLEAELYGPLGLRSTGFRGAERQGGPFAATSHGNPFERRMVHDTTFGYRIEGDPLSWAGWRRHTLVGEVNDGNAWHAFGGEAGHAGLFSTADDLGELLELLLGRGIHEGRRILGPEVVDRFLEPTGEGQALGWQTPDYLPASSFAHTGFTGTFVFGVPDAGLAVVLLANRQNVGVDAETRYPDVGPLQRQVARALTGYGPPAPGG